MKRGNILAFLRTAGLLLAFSFAHSQSAQAEEFPAGKIIEKVVCSADASFSYSLYLPSSYDAKKKWPVLFAMDPAARGLVPVEHFKDAAETYGYILAGSNESRNGPWAPSAKAILAMLNDVVGRFATDQQRVYTAGLSGGARVACRLGSLLKGQIAGVIACGAGFPAEMAPSEAPPFVLFGTAGVEDFNYVEMKQLDRALDLLGAPHRVEFFDGGHGWAAPELCTRAIEWMELQAMKSGLRQRSEPLIDSLFKKDVERARALEAAGSIYQAYLGYSAIAREFKGLRDVAEYERKSASLKDSKEVRQALKQAKDQEAEERRLATELYRSRAKLAGAALSSENSDAAQIDSSYAPPSDGVSRSLIVGDLRRTLADLKKRSEAAESTPDRALARRLLNQYMASAYESSVSLLDRKLYTRAVAVLELDAEAMPDNTRVLFRLACAYSLKGDKKKAIEALRKSVQKGFSNTAELESNKSLDAIREEAAYKKIVEELKAKK
ncbi:MAG: hypothetical protein AABO41_18320 [Acidobacteriota bacterium]